MRQLRAASTPAPWPYMKYPKNVKAFVELATEGGEAGLFFDESELQFHRHLISAIYLPFLDRQKWLDLISIYLASSNHFNR